MLIVLIALDLARASRVLDVDGDSRPHLGHFARTVGPSRLIVGLDRAQMLRLNSCLVSEDQPMP